MGNKNGGISLFLTIITSTFIMIETFEDVCKSENCFNAATILLQNMNSDIDPCVNFYEYACGNFHKTGTLSEELPVFSILSRRYAEYMDEIKSLLETAKSLSEPESIRKIKDFYKVCLNSTLEEEIQDISTFVEESLGNLPLVMNDDWDAKYYNWQDMLTFLTKNGFRNTGIFDIKFEKPLDSFTPKFYIEYQQSALHTILGNFSSTFDEANTKLRDILQSLFDVFQVEVTDEENFSSQIEMIVKFMQQYMKIPTYSRPLSSHSIQELRILIPDFNWLKIFQRIVNRHLSTETVVYIEGINWLKAVVRTVQDTPKRTIANYLVLNTILSLYVNRELSLSLQSAIRSSIHNVTDIPIPYEPINSKSDFCIQHSCRISNPIKALHFKQYFFHELTNSVKLIAKEIHETFFSLFYASHPSETLLVDVERSFQNNKTDIPVEIAVDEKYLNDLYLDNEYEKLIADWKSNFRNVLAIKQFTVQELLSGKKSLGLQQPDVKYIGSLENGLQKIVIPGSLLSGIVYSVDRSPGFNFGTLGFKISEGLVMYLQPLLSDLFKQQPLYSGDPLTDTPEYMLRIYSSFVKQLPEFQQWPQSLQWKEQYLYKTILLQNIALKLTYSAYENWQLKYNHDDKKLPGIGLNSTQLFWLGFTTLNCVAHEETYTKMLSFYTPNENKIIVLTLFHLNPDFYSAFQCQDSMSI